MNILCLVAVKDVWLDRSGISNSERKDWGKAIEDRLYSQSLWLSLSLIQMCQYFSLHVSRFLFISISLAMCSPQHVSSSALPHWKCNLSMWPLPLHVKSLGFIGLILASMHVQILESFFCNSIWHCWRCKNDRFHLARNITGVLSQLFCLIDNIT